MSMARAYQVNDIGIGVIRSLGEIGITLWAFPDKTVGDDLYHEAMTQIWSYDAISSINYEVRMPDGSMWILAICRDGMVFCGDLETVQKILNWRAR